MAASVAVFAPGRVNLIGEHTDTSDGLVLPVAIANRVSVRGSPGGDRISLSSHALPGLVELDAVGRVRSKLPGWGRYVSAAAELLAEAGRAPVGFEGVVDSTLPVGAGLSSSAALTVAVALALCRAASFELPPINLARLAREAEHRAVGVPCGLMDPAASLLGRRGRALLLDTGAESWRLVPLPAELAIVALDSGVRHALEHSDYATRSSELMRALPALRGARPADMTVEDALRAARAAAVDDVALRRLRHVVSENERVRAFTRVLESPGSVDCERLGEIMLEGHRSLRDDYEVSTPELDLLVEIAREEGAIGARLTGGGFGGSVVALVPSNRAKQIAASAARSYSERSGREGSGYVLETSDGAGDLAG
jgi:galactokinase